MRRIRRQPASASSSVARAADVGQMRADVAGGRVDPPRGAGGAVVERGAQLVEVHRLRIEHDVENRRRTALARRRSTAGRRRHSGPAGRSTSSVSAASSGAVTGEQHGPGHRLGPQVGLRAVLAALLGHDAALHLGVHPPRVDRRDPHAVAPPPRRAARRRRPAARTCSPRRTPSRAGREPGPGVEQHHPAAGGPQRGQQQPGQLGHGHHVDLELPPPGGGVVSATVPSSADAGRVHQHVEPLDAAYRLGHRGAVGELHRPRPGPGQLGGEGLQRRRCRGRRAAGRGSGRAPGHGRADTPGRAGDQGERSQVRLGHAGSTGVEVAGMRVPPA